MATAAKIIKLIKQKAIITLIVGLYIIHIVAGDCPANYNSVECCVKSYQVTSQTTTNSLNGQTVDVVLNVHNTFRAAHHVSPLTYSQELQNEAQQLANECVDKIKSTGENMSVMFGETVQQDHEILASAITTWYNTIPKYNFNEPKFNEKAGLATQLLWKSTRQVGCAVAACSKSKRLIVCKYNPPGNVIGQFGENVLPK